MTVKELIIELLKYPMDVKVMIPDRKSHFYNFANTVRNDVYITDEVIIECKEDK